MFKGISLKFDWRCMGLGAYLPFLVVALLIFITAFNQGQLPDIMPAIEMLFPIFGSWWSIYVLHDLLSEGSNEVLLSYPVKRWNMGIVRVLSFFLLYLILMMVMLVIMSPWIGSQNILPLAMQLGAQSFFYSGLGFLAIVLTMNTGWSLIIVTCYLSLQIMGRDGILPLLDIYLHNARPFPIQQLTPMLLKATLFGVAFYANAQYVLSTTKRVK